MSATTTPDMDNMEIGKRIVASATKDAFIEIPEGGGPDSLIWLGEKPTCAAAAPKRPVESKS